MTAGTVMNSTTVTDNTTAVSRTWATSTSGGTHVISSVSNEGLSEIHIQNVASATNTQLRPTGITITYIAPDAALEQITFTMPIAKVGVGRTQQITNNSAEKGYTGSITYETSNPNIATIVNGVVTGVAAGSVTITANAAATTGFKAVSTPFAVTVVSVTHALNNEIALNDFSGATNAYGTSEKWADFKDESDNSIDNWYGTQFLGATDGTSSLNYLLVKANDGYILSPNISSVYGYSVIIRYTNNSGEAITQEANMPTLTFTGGQAQKALSPAMFSTNSTNIGFTINGAAAAVKIWEIKLIPNASLTIGPAEYATYYNSVNAYTMPAGCAGYVFDYSEGGLANTPEYAAGSTVPAGEPLIIQGTEGSYNLVFTTTEDITYKSIGGNDLDGTDVETELTADANSYFYGLSLDKAPNDTPESVGFYWMNNTGAAFTNGAHKAYLKLPKTAGAPSRILFNENDVTNIENVEASEKAVKFIENGKLYIQKDGVVYDAMGKTVR